VTVETTLPYCLRGGAGGWLVLFATLSGMRPCPFLRRRCRAGGVVRLGCAVGGALALPRCKKIPAVITVFEPAGTTMTLQRHTEVVRSDRHPEFACEIQAQCTRGHQASKEIFESVCPGKTSRSVPGGRGTASASVELPRGTTAGQLSKSNKVTVGSYRGHSVCTGLMSDFSQSGDAVDSRTP
jgi:hypothetical protein